MILRCALALLLTGCVALSIDADGATRVWTLGQVSVSTSCPAQTIEEKDGSRLESTGGGLGEEQSPCVAILGGPISSAFAGLVTSIMGFIAGALTF